MIKNMLINGSVNLNDHKIDEFNKNIAIGCRNMSLVLNDLENV